VGFYVLLVLLLGISAPPIILIDIKGKSSGDCRTEWFRPKGARRSASEKEPRLPYCVR
jgi:hypothetical protein